MELNKNLIDWNRYFSVNDWDYIDSCSDILINLDLPAHELHMSIESLLKNPKIDNFEYAMNSFIDNILLNKNLATPTIDMIWDLKTSKAYSCWDMVGAFKIAKHTNSSHDVLEAIRAASYRSVEELKGMLKKAKADKSYKLDNDGDGNRDLSAMRAIQNPNYLTTASHITYRPNIVE